MALVNDVHPMVAICAAALLIDWLFGEPRFAHPLVGFGRMATRVEGRLNDLSWSSPLLRRFYGLLAVFSLVAPPVLLAFLLDGFWWAQLAGLSLALGAHSLVSHARAVSWPLSLGNVRMARTEVARMVSRDTREMDQTDVSRAAIESVLENGNDAIFATLFWFVVAGLPGVVLHRLVNTLDAMWGYRTPRFRHFGWAAARLDDLLNLVPARLTALSYALMGRHPVIAVREWREKGHLWASPNAGPVLAAGAGAMGRQLGGTARYGGLTRARPVVGPQVLPGHRDIERACQLVLRSVLFWLLAILVGAYALA
ncbi:MAG: adenosylcobinamide-phosphate synthase CbiB [Pseudomonadota bacterium]|nr:adenosylcobinamide-phosphate synthase CbiB [Pseudomonadota bacterium]